MGNKLYTVADRLYTMVNNLFTIINQSIINKLVIKKIVFLLIVSNFDMKLNKNLKYNIFVQSPILSKEEITTHLSVFLK